MPIPRKIFDDIRKTMGDKSAKEFVRASERPVTHTPHSTAKLKALQKKKGKK